MKITQALKVVKSSSGQIYLTDPRGEPLHLPDLEGKTLYLVEDILPSEEDGEFIPWRVADTMDKLVKEGMLSPTTVKKLSRKLWDVPPSIYSTRGEEG